MTQKELNRVHVIQQCIDGVLTNGEATLILALNQRQVILLKKGVRNEGPQSMIHRNRNRQPVHTLPQSVKEQIIHLTFTIYTNANFTHFTELFSLREKISLNPSSLYRILIQAGIKSLKATARKPSTAYRSGKR